MNIQNKIEPEIFEYIKEIASKIKNNRASVMVGAGFSRNAEQISQTDKQFLDWNSLGNVFFEKVNGHKPDGKNHYLNVLKLAEEVEAAFGRTVLNEIIRENLPDAEYAPSQLHEKLLNLGWKDVFTTNYDTLLERTLERITDRHYSIILNKEDLADPQRTAYWIKYFSEQEECKAFAFNATVGKKQLIAKLKEALMEVTAEKRERMAKKGIRKQTIRCMIVGIPNVGKSTFINILVGKKVAQTGDKAGVTRGKQWIRLDDDLELLDTPGILWPKFEDQQVGVRLALIGSMNDEILNVEEMSLELIGFLCEEYKGLLAKRFDIAEELEADVHEENGALKILTEIANVRKCFKKGDELDLRKAAHLLLDDFRSGKLGRITLEKPEISEG